MTRHPVVIVGGGVSGLAAAVALGSRGIPPLVLEQKPSAGGRAYSFQDTQTGEIIDNGQHVLIAGYRNTMWFLNTIGTIGLLSIQPHPLLRFHHPQRGFRKFSIPKLPSPLNFVAAALSTGLVRFRDRQRLLRAGRAFIRNDLDVIRTLNVRQWLVANGQSEECRRSLWEPLAVAIMNELPERASAMSFVRALRDSFLGGWRSACIAIPKVGLSSLYVDQARRFIAQKGGAVMCNADVQTVLFSESAATGVRLRDGSEIHADALILSVPPNRISMLISPEQQERLSLGAVNAFGFSPIVSTHLWFEQSFMQLPFLGLIGRRTQWVFDKRGRGTEQRSGGHISAIISAAHETVSLSNEEIIRNTIEDLRSVYGKQVPEPYHAVVIREKRATVSITPSVEIHRPTQKTAFSNFFLAGDWTQTGHPATIEGAISSAVRCAGLAHQYLKERT